MAKGLPYYDKDVWTLEQDNVTHLLIQKHEVTTYTH